MQENFHVSGVSPRTPLGELSALLLAMTWAGRKGLATPSQSNPHLVLSLSALTSPPFVVRNVLYYEHLRPPRLLVNRR